MAPDCPKSCFCPYSEFYKRDLQEANSTFLTSTSHLSSPGMACP